jgi:hypothetical protein
MSLPETNTIIEIPQLTRQISSNVSDQRDQPTCWIFTASRVILKFIKSFLQDLRTLPTDNTACDKYYSFDKFNANLINKNRFFLKQKQIPDFFKRITSRKCGEKEYKNLCLFMFIYYNLAEKFGCSSGATFTAMEWFTNEFLNKKMDSIDDTNIYILPNPYNNVALELMNRFCSIDKPKIFANAVSLNLTSDLIIQSDTKLIGMKNVSSGGTFSFYSDNYIFFFNIVKSIIDQNLYVSIGTDLYGDGNKNFGNYRNNTPLPEYNGCIIKTKFIGNEWRKDLSNAGSHSMTIVNYVDDINNKAFVIKNSWGVDWGINGTITIPVSELVKHCYLDIYYLSFVDIDEVIKKREKERRDKLREEEKRRDEEKKETKRINKGGRKKKKTKKMKNKAKRKKNKTRIKNR